MASYQILQRRNTAEAFQLLWQRRLQHLLLQLRWRLQRRVRPSSGKEIECESEQSKSQKLLNFNCFHQQLPLHEHSSSCHHEAASSQYS